MKALSLTQPWATACVHRLRGGPPVKMVETRGWRTNYQGVLFIHAAKAFPEGARWFANDLKMRGLLPNVPLPLGAIIGRVMLLGCRRTEDIREHINVDELMLGDYSDSRYGFMFGDASEFATPIPCRGALNLWNVPPEIVTPLDREGAAQ